MNYLRSLTRLNLMFFQVGVWTLLAVFVLLLISPFIAIIISN